MTYKVTRDQEYLEHHGIEGQKWGKRNGPPYPLDYRDHSKSEKKHLNKYIAAHDNDRKYDKKYDIHKAESEAQKEIKKVKEDETSSREEKNAKIHDIKVKLDGEKASIESAYAQEDARFLNKLIDEFGERKVYYAMSQNSAQNSMVFGGLIRASIENKQIKTRLDRANFARGNQQ